LARDKWIAGAALVLGPCVLAIAAACIPDLEMALADAGNESSQPRCGDGYVDYHAGEQCDPGPGDAGVIGCTPDCRLACGDGYIDYDAGEQCDPGPGDASVIGCTPGCRIACGDGGLLYATHCYYTPPGPNGRVGRPDIEGANSCATSGGHVVTFVSENEYQAVATGLTFGQEQLFWVGLSYDNGVFGYVPFGVTDEPGWSQVRCKGCFAHVSDYDAGIPRLPASDGGLPPVEPPCVAAYHTTSNDWVAVPCDTRPIGLRVICEREPAGVTSLAGCDSTGATCIWLSATVASKRYLYYDRNATADSAALSCQSLGGRLVVFGSREEREQLWRELDNLPLTSARPNRIWIGLTRQLYPDAGPGPGATWIWDDTTPADDGPYPPPWGDREPRGLGPRAYAQHANGQFDDQLARTDALPTEQMPYVCEVPIADASTD
jgi:hypothetical protein